MCRVDSTPEAPEGPRNPSCVQVCNHPYWTEFHTKTFRINVFSCWQDWMNFWYLPWPWQITSDTRGIGIDQCISIQPLRQPEIYLCVQQLPRASQGPHRYGRGAYLAEHCTKADEYAVDENLAQLVVGMAELHGFVKCIKCTTHQKSSNILKPWKLFGNVGLTAKQCVFMCFLVKGEKSEKPWVTEAPEGPFAKKISLFLKINFLPPFYTALCWQSLFDGMPLFLENPTVYEKDMGSFWSTSVPSLEVSMRMAWSSLSGLTSLGAWHTTSFPRPGGYYEGVYALLLCRVCLGKFYYTKASWIQTSCEDNRSEERHVWRSVIQTVILLKIYGSSMTMKLSLISHRS